MNIKDGDELVFEGYTWDELNWNFDAPCIITKPIKIEGYVSSINIGSIFSFIEEICIGICIDKRLPVEEDNIADDIEDYIEKTTLY